VDQVVRVAEEPVGDAQGRPTTPCRVQWNVASMAIRRSQTESDAGQPVEQRRLGRVDVRPTRCSADVSTRSQLFTKRVWSR
jgi:hypothetical protein